MIPHLSIEAELGRIIAATGEYFLPVWVQILIGLAAVTVAVGVIWSQLIRPTTKLIYLLDNALPVLNKLTVQFKDSPHAFEVLDKIYKEFKTDSGSSLRDVINRLESGAQVLTVNAEAARLLSEQDRQRLAHLIELLDRVSVKQVLDSKTVNRLEKGASQVAMELDAAQTRAEKIQGAPGEAADAAVRRTEKETLP